MILAICPRLDLAWIYEQNWNLLQMLLSADFQNLTTECRYWQEEQQSTAHWCYSLPKIQLYNFLDALCVSAQWYKVFFISICHNLRRLSTCICYYIIQTFSFLIQVGRFFISSSYPWLISVSLMELSVWFLVKCICLFLKIC